jgi:hypothetical protein
MRGYMKNSGKRKNFMRVVQSRPPSSTRGRRLMRRFALPFVFAVLFAITAAAVLGGR